MRIDSITEEISVSPSSYDDNYQAYSVADLENGFTDTSSTTYASIYLTRGASAITYIYYNFAFNIPLTATINSVTAKAKGYISTTGYVTARTFQLYSGSTQKGTAVNPTTSTSTLTFTDPGTWTAQELNNAKIRAYAKRGTSRPDNSYVLRFYGAYITVNYTYNQTVYQVTSSSTSQSITISPSSSDVNEGGDLTLTISGNLSGATVTDNTVDVTSSIVPLSPPQTGGTYTITNIQADHVVLVTSPTGDKIFIKINNAWVESQNIFTKNNGTWPSVGDVYKKTGGSWVQQSDKSAMFDPNSIYISG